MTVMAERDVLTKVAEVDAHEGPVWLDGALYFTSLPRHERPGHPVVDIRRLVPETGEVTTVRADANAANGMTLAPDGRLLVCEQGTMDEPARISAVDPATGQAETVVDALAGLPLNSPNDVVVKRDGTIWFTDPSYGFLQGFKPEPAHGDFVYRFDPATGRLTVVASDFDKPNGLAFSPDETVLYVGDSGANHEPGSFDPRRPHHIRAFDVVGNRLRKRPPVRGHDARLPGRDQGRRRRPRLRLGVQRRAGLRPGRRARRRDRAAGRRELHLRRREPRHPLHHDRHGRLGRGRQRERSVTAMPVVRTRKIIDDGGADSVIAAATAKANENGSRVVIAVVDPAGELIQLRRTEGAQVASSRVAVDKARTAAIFVRPSRDIEEQVSGGRLGALALHGASALTGGIPLVVDGEVVGAIGTSGETPDEDEAISIAGAAASFTTKSAPELTYEGARMAAEAVAAEATTPRRRAGRRRRRLGRRARLPLAARRRAGRERRRLDRQGAHGRDLPAAQQGLRGPGLQRPRLCPPPRPRGSAPGRHPDRPRRPRRRRGRRERRLLGRRGPGAGGARRRRRAGAHERQRKRQRCRVLRRRRRPREVPDGRPAARHAALQARRRPPRGAGRGRVPRAHRRRDARRRGQGHGRHRRRDGRAARGRARRGARHERRTAGRRTNSARATCSRSRAASRTSSPRCPTRSSISS